MTARLSSSAILKLMHCFTLLESHSPYGHVILGDFQCSFEHTKLHSIIILGKLPLQVNVDKLLISYWLRLLNKDEFTLAHIIYLIALSLFVREEYKVDWLCRVNNIIDSYGLSYL